MLMALTNFVRLSLLKAAQAVVSSAAWQEIQVRSEFVTFYLPVYFAVEKLPSASARKASPGSFDSAPQSPLLRDRSARRFAQDDDSV
jgi:hypothetical protein